MARWTWNEEARVWKTIWSAGHGVGTIDDIPPAAELCARLIAEYKETVGRLAAEKWLADVRRTRQDLRH